MLLALFRHAPAEQPRAGLEEAERGLTRRGRRRMLLACAGLQTLGLSFERLEHSPWRRARQTAECLRPLCRHEMRPNPLLAAAPSAELLESLAGKSLALVGHEPWISELARLLLLSPQHPSALQLCFKKGALLLLEGPPQAGRMRLLAFLPPRLLRSAGR